MLPNVLPRYITSPRVGAITPNSKRAKVVLPLPLSPTIAVIEGGSVSTRSEKLSNAIVDRRAKSPPPKTLVSWRASSKTVIAWFRYHRTGGTPRLDLAAPAAGPAAPHGSDP